MNIPDNSTISSTKPIKGLHIDWINLILLLIVSPLFIFPKSAFWPVFFIIPLMWTARKFILKRFSEPTPLDIPIFIFLIGIAGSIARIRDFSYSLPKIAGVIFALAFFYAIVNLLKSEKLIRFAVSLFMATGVLFSLVGLLGMTTFKEKHLYLLEKLKNKIPQLQFNLPGAELGFAPTVVGGMLLLFIPLLFIMAILSKKWLRWASLFGFIVTLGVLVLTQARGAWSGLFISFIITVIIWRLIKPVRDSKSQWKPRKKKLITILVIVLIAVIAIGVVSYTASLSDKLKPGIKQAEGTLLFRVQLWDLSLPLIRQNPIWGIGLNNFRVLVPEVRFFLSHAHNQLIHIAVEMGIPAMIAYFSILLAVMYMAFYTWKNSSDPWISYASLALGSGQIGHFFFCMTDAIPPGAKVGLLVWISFGLITALYRYTQTVNSEQCPKS